MPQLRELHVLLSQNQKPLLRNNGVLVWVKPTLYEKHAL